MRSTAFGRFDEHSLGDIRIAASGARVARCVCGFTSPPLLSPRLAVDVWRDHRRNQPGLLPRAGA